MAKYTEKQAIDELKRQIDEIDNVRKKPRLSPKFRSWQTKTSELLAQIYGRKAKQCKDFVSIQYNLAAFSNQTPESKFDEVFQQGLKNAAIVLSSIIKDIQSNGFGAKAAVVEPPAPVEIPEPPAAEVSKPKTPEPVTSKPVTSKPATSEPAPRIARSTVSSSKMFIVYSDESSIERELTEFLARIGITPVLVEGKPGQLGMLFERLDANPDVSFAIVLLDPDEESITHDVVFELGILVGSLGRDRVCGLMREKLDILANYSGISYVTVDQAGAWKFMMIKHLKSVGYNVDANLAL